MNNTFFSALEWIAVVAGLINCFLLTRQTIWAWPAGLLCVFLYTFVFYHNQLYSDVILNIVYVALNVYGWYKWGKGSTDKSTILPVTTLSRQHVLLLTVMIIPGFMIWGYVVGKNTNAVYVYPDAFILVTSLCAQYLLAIKKIENWILWIIVDIVAIIIYYLKGLYTTAGLYFIYIVICSIGFFEWKKTLKTITLNTGSSQSI